MSQRKVSSSSKRQVHSSSSSSSLLSHEELLMLQTILGSECTVVRSTVAEVYRLNHQKWKCKRANKSFDLNVCEENIWTRSSKAESKVLKKTGILLLVKDPTRRAYFIKVVTITYQLWLWFLNNCSHSKGRPTGPKFLFFKH